MYVFMYIRKIYTICIVCIMFCFCMWQEGVYNIQIFCFFLQAKAIITTKSNNNNKNKKKKITKELNINLPLTYVIIILQE